MLRLVPSENLLIVDKTLCLEPAVNEPDLSKGGFSVEVDTGWLNFAIRSFTDVIFIHLKTNL